MSKRILAIDPGTYCGYSWLDIPSVLPPALKPQRMQSGIWDLSVKRHEGGGMRFLRMKKHLIEMKPDMILYEEVRGHKGTSAAHIYGGIIAQIQVYCIDEGRCVDYVGIPVGTIKRRATGKGNCGKIEMIEAANATLMGPGDEFLSTAAGASNKDDNIADAMWLMQIGIDDYSELLAEGGI